MSAIHLPAYADDTSAASSSSISSQDSILVETARRLSLQEALDDPETALPPAYTCSVHFTGTVYRKLENTLDAESDKLHVPFRRSWQAVHLVLRGTILEVYKPKPGMTLEIPKATQAGDTQRHATTVPKRANSLPLEAISSDGEVPIPRHRSGSAPALSHTLNGEVDLSTWQRAHVYSLRGAVAGIASDYRKRPNVLRVRCDRDQFLIAVPQGALQCVQWLDCIQKASGIAEPLESRREPLHIWAPRRMKMRTTVQQAYELFEATAEGALKQRTFAGRVRGAVSSSQSGTSGSSRSGTVASDFWNRTAASSRQLARQRSVARPGAPTRAISTFSIASTRSQKGGRGSSSGSQTGPPMISTTSVVRRPVVTHRPSSSRGTHSTKPERYVCAVLQSTFPRQTLLRV
ncbi:hypothetical protein BCR37DRAFT_394233 [Protomyces lactucae-debilis]|uniref:PH domain-containing protein n=1 Tax=Protomyces lactucae-debilis TaxID=2754530 RepID=A0A1Y2F6M9_PROLT|nr:uncharacterized protein BCR37DRAFT_394233 [Protomyces lactucae-debilis]ORY79509.1 hypothetical protein BCR37DRAFT_394233 [Protomyces lactucae-debilis]